MVQDSSGTPVAESRALGAHLKKKKIPLSSGSRSVSAARREKPGGGVYNSVIGESRANGGSALEFREYILYESKQVYPE